jgi:hypothetical protein
MRYAGSGKMREGDEGVIKNVGGRYRELDMEGV